MGCSSLQMAVAARDRARRAPRSFALSDAEIYRAYGVHPGVHAALPPYVPFWLMADAPSPGTARAFGWRDGP
jgi:hypothetical protein